MSPSANLGYPALLSSPTIPVNPACASPTQTLLTPGGWGPWRRSCPHFPAGGKDRRQVSEWTKHVFPAKHPQNLVWALGPRTNHTLQKAWSLVSSHSWKRTVSSFSFSGDWPARRELAEMAQNCTGTSSLPALSAPNETGHHSGSLSQWPRPPPTTVFSVTCPLNVYFGARAITHQVGCMPCTQLSWVQFLAFQRVPQAHHK